MDFGILLYRWRVYVECSLKIAERKQRERKNWLLISKLLLLFIIINETRIIIIIIYFAWLFFYMILIFCVYTNGVLLSILNQLPTCVYTSIGLSMLIRALVFNVVILGHMISYFIYKTSMKIMNKNISRREEQKN